MESEEEIEGKAYVHYKSWHETYKNLIDEKYLQGITLEKCNTIAHQWRDNIIVAKDREKVIGFVGYNACQNPMLSNCGEIFALYVLNEYQGKKVGYELMNAAFRKLSEFKNIVVWVLKGNERAIHFYERYGFYFDGSEKEIMLGSPRKELRMIYKKR
ncbi:MAG: GNAT family N-acetyltransferase [Anaeroplasmataceae bacterium]|nr:GNAT family N-acetyltransferase [Anaeroplasmataceae bacterium]